jgi:hypothetical protein
MTTVQFQPSPTANTRFQATLDSQVYNVVINWNLFGARYYVNIYTLAGQRIVTEPLIGSPLGYDLSSLTSDNNIASAVTAVSHTYTVGSIVPLQIAGNTPTAFNGTFNCNITGPNSFTYPLPGTIDQATQLGTATYTLSLTAGYFNSTMVYFPDNEQIIITP